MARPSGKFYLFTMLLHYWRLVMPDDSEIYCTTKFDKDMLVNESLNYIKRTCTGNEDVTFTIHIPCKQLKDIHDKKINIFSGYSYAFKTAGHQMAQCHEFLAMLYVFLCNVSGCE